MVSAMDKDRYFCWSDISTWSSLLRKASEDATPEDVRALLSKLYSGYRAFHGCKPVSVNSYRERGLLAHDRAGFHGAIKQEILAAYPAIDPALIDRAIREATPGGGRAEVCAFLDRRYLLREGKEFCVEGSELPLRIAARLRDHSGVSVRQLFTDRGTPTIVEFGVNWEDSPYHVGTELHLYVHEGLEAARAGIEPRVFDMPHVQTHTVPPGLIFNVEHPTFS